MIKGTSIINHNARSKLGLGIAEYVVMQFLQKAYEDGMKINESSSMYNLGYPLISIERVMGSLIDKNMIASTNNGIITPAAIWGKTHGMKDVEFGIFWQPVEINEEKLQWRNCSKIAAKKKLKSSLKEKSIDFIIYSKLRYFMTKFQSKSFDWLMNAETFLGPDKHYDTYYTLNETSEDILNKLIVDHYSSDESIDLSQYITVKSSSDNSGKLVNANSGFFDD